MAIPKIIHYCWFGKNPMPLKVKKCIQSWKKNCPDYKIIEWNEDNYDVNQNSYIKEAYTVGKWAFVSDYVRLDVVYQYGGIYLDTDVELIRGCDQLLSEKVFFAMEKQNCSIATGLGFGAERENTIIGQLKDIYSKLSFLLPDGTYNLVACPIYTTRFFLDRGYMKEDRTQRINDVLILGSDYFCPMDYHTGLITKTENTIGIHWYEASWFEIEDKEIHQMEMKIRQVIPGKVGDFLCFVYRKTYRVVEYTKKGIIFKRIKEIMRR